MRNLVLAAALLAAVAGAAAQPGPRLEPDAEVTWSSGDLAFGGFSGIAVRDGGAGFLTVSDRGAWASAAMERDDGRLVGVRLTGIGPLHGIDGAELDETEQDAEEIALDPEGRPHVAFEGFHRIRRYDRLDGPPVAVPPHPDFPGLQLNSALEAMTFDAEGRLYAIPERSGRLDRPFPVYRLVDGEWDKRLKVRRDGAFLVSGAAIGPDGRLYLLERDFGWLRGFATRIRRFDIGAEALTNEVTLLETGFGELDNMEGISVWDDAEGRIRVTLISDDNFFPLQRTIVAEYLLVE